MKIVIDESICSKIEILHYEVLSRKEIIAAYLQMSDNITSTLFKVYQDDYKEYFREYNKTKHELQVKYGIPVGSTWNLDFATRELTY